MANLQVIFEIRRIYVIFFFSKHCTPIFNGSTVPVSINLETRERLSSLEFCVDNIAKIIRSLDQQKAMVMMIFRYA